MNWNLTIVEGRPIFLISFCVKNDNLVPFMTTPLPERGGNVVIGAEVSAFNEIPEIQEKQETVSKPFDYSRLESLPFAKLIDEQVLDREFVQIEDSSEECEDGAIKAMKVLFKHLKGDKTVDSIVSSGPEDIRKEASEAAAFLLFMGYETIYLANERSLVSLYNNISKVRKSVEAKRLTM